MASAAIVVCQLFGDRIDPMGSVRLLLVFGMLAVVACFAQTGIGCTDNDLGAATGAQARKGQNHCEKGKGKGALHACVVCRSTPASSVARMWRMVFAFADHGR